MYMADLLEMPSRYRGVSVPLSEIRSVLLECEIPVTITCFVDDYQNSQLRCSWKVLRKM